MNILFPDLTTIAKTNMTESTPPTPEESTFAITVGVVASVVGALLVISVIIIITLKHRKRTYEESKRQDEYAVSYLPNSVKVFDNNRPTPFRGSSTSYSPKTSPSLENLGYVQSESKGPDERMDNDRV